jgi:hypothetical protein
MMITKHLPIVITLALLNIFRVWETRFKSKTNKVGICINMGMSLNQL